MILEDCMLLYHGSYTAVKETAINFAISRLDPYRLKNQCCFLSERAIACLEFVGETLYER